MSLQSQIFEDFVHETFAKFLAPAVHGDLRFPIASTDGDVTTAPAVGLEFTAMLGQQFLELFGIH
jgi:hypothetical protein